MRDGHLARLAQTDQTPAPRTMVAFGTSSERKNRTRLLANAIVPALEIAATVSTRRQPVISRAQAQREAGDQDALGSKKIDGRPDG